MKFRSLKQYTFTISQLLGARNLVATWPVDGPSQGLSKCELSQARLGKDPLLNSLLWLRSLLAIGWSHQFFVTMPFPRAAHSASASFSQSHQRGERVRWKPRYSDNLNLGETCHHICISYSLGVSHYVPSTSKRRGLHRAFISGCGDIVGHARGCQSHTGSGMSTVSSFTYLPLPTSGVNTQPLIDSLSSLHLNKLFSFFEFMSHAVVLPMFFSLLSFLFLLFCFYVFLKFLHSVEIGEVVSCP